MFFDWLFQQVPKPKQQEKMAVPVSLVITERNTLSKEAEYHLVIHLDASINLNSTCAWLGLTLLGLCSSFGK